MKSDELNPKKVISRGDAGRDCEIDETLVSDHRVDSPSPVRVESIFPNFEPLKTSNRRG